MNVFTVNGLITALKKVSKEAPSGGETKVCLDDFEGNMGAFGEIETLEVVYDPEVDRITILCDRHEKSRGSALI